MKTQLPLVQAIGFCLIYVALGFLFPAFTISPNPFEAAPFWIITSALAVLLIGLVFGLLTGRFTPQFKPTAFNGWGLAYSRWCFSWKATCFLLRTHWLAAFPIVLVIVLVFGMHKGSNRSPNSS